MNTEICHSLQAKKFYSNYLVNHKVNKKEWDLMSRHLKELAFKLLMLKVISNFKIQV
jgi:hypothetical protein